MPNRPTGARNGRWNNGRMISSHGYVLVRVGKDHPLGNSRAVAYEHHVVWAAAGRRLPNADEILHHKDENRTNNSLSNLVLMTRKEHAELHAKARRRKRDGTFAKEIAA